MGDMADENVDVMAVYATTGRVQRPAPWALWPSVCEACPVGFVAECVRPALWALWPSV